jgi:hypothetical protein
LHGGVIDQDISASEVASSRSNQIDGGFCQRIESDRSSGQSDASSVLSLIAIDRSGDNLEAARAEINVT